MAKQIVKVGVANEGERNLELELVEKWEPKDIHYIGTTAFFKHEKTYYSMNREDFKRIFPPNAII
jgi:hypothetical protein